jgi:AraC family transcriptional regulator
VSIAPKFHQHLAGRFTETVLQQSSQTWIAPLAKYASPDGFGEEVWIPSTPETVIAVRLSGSPIVAEMGRARRSGAGRDVALQPAGLPNYFRCMGPTEFVQLFLPDEMLDRAALSAGVPALSGRLRDDLVFVDTPDLNRRLIDCARSAFSDSQPSRLEIEGHVLLVLAELVRLHDSRTHLPEKGGLAPWQVKRLTEYIEERLGDDVSLEELSRLVDLSSFHLCRAFKQSTGLPPHRWRMQRRIQRARMMLEGTNIPVVEVAAIVGFDDPSGFAAAFRKAVGVSPSQYRRERRS